MTTFTYVFSGTPIYWGADVAGQYQFDNWGATTNDDVPWAEAFAHPNAWDTFEAHTGKAITCASWGGSGSSIVAWDDTPDSRARNRNAFSMYTMGASAQDILDLVANSNTNGVMTRLDAWANGVKTSARPVLMRPIWEMNGIWGYSWQLPTTSAANYVIAWRRIWQRVADVMTSTAGSGLGTNTGNCSFCWCPNVWNSGTSPIADPTAWYPGSAYVDWLGMDGYAQVNGDTVAQVFNTTYGILTGLGPGKPIAICETSCDPALTSPTKAAWITDLLGTWLPAHTAVKMFVWYNDIASFTGAYIEVGTGSQAAFAAGIASSYFKTNIVTSGTFPNGAKVPIP